jgi:hypothetical protein
MPSLVVGKNQRKVPEHNNNNNNNHIVTQEYNQNNIIQVQVLMH